MALARLRGSAPILATIMAVVALVSAFAVATVIFFDARGTAGLTTELSTRSGSHLALRASFDRASDAEQQDADVRAAIDRTFAGVSVDLTVIRTLQAEAYYRVVDADGSELAGPATASTFPDLADHARFETGGPASTGSEVAIQAEAARALGLEVGDEVLINELPFTVSGTWRALDALDPRWFGDVTVVTGTGENDRLGPFAIDESAWGRMTAPPVAAWTLTPTTLDQITTTSSSALRRAWAAAQREWRGTVPEYETMAVEQPLSRTLDEFAVRYTGLRAIEPVVFVLLAGTALVGLSQIVQLLIATRERESALFWARGQSPPAVAGRLTAEVAISSLLGGAIGAGAVIAVAMALGRVDDLSAVRSTAFVLPALIVGGVTALAAIAAGRSARSISTPSRGGRLARRVGRVALPGVVALVTIAAALAVWQLRLYGSPIVTDSSGFSSIDPIAVVAPAAALIAIVLIGLVAFPGVVGLVSRRSGSRGVPSYLAARTLARDARRVVAPLVVVALAVGSVAVAATFAATWSASFTRAAQLYAGSDVRVSSRFAPISPEQLAEVAATEGVGAAAPVETEILSVGTIRGTTLAAAPEALRHLASTADGQFDPVAAATAIDMQAPGPVLPPGAITITVTVEAIGFADPPTIAAWIAEPLGTLRSVPFGAPTPQVDGTLAYTAEVDGIEGTIVSFDLGLSEPVGKDAARFALVELSAETASSTEPLALDQFWVVDTLIAQLAAPASSGTSFVLDDALSSVRMTATLDGTSTDQVRPRLLVSAGLASALELEVGDVVVFGLREADQRLNGIVAGIVPVIPGARTGDALLVDLAVANHLRLRSDRLPTSMTELWVTTSAPDRVGEEIRDVLPANTRIDTIADPVGREVLGAASLAMWGAALSCVLIALVAVGSAARSRVRFGRGEFGALRAIGLTARGQASIIVRELGVVLLVALVTGLVAGALVSALTVPQLARAAVDRADLTLDTPLGVDAVGLLALLGVLALGIAVVLARTGRRARALASTSLPGEGSP